MKVKAGTQPKQLEPLQVAAKKRCVVQQTLKSPPMVKKLPSFNGSAVKGDHSTWGAAANNCDIKLLCLSQKRGD